MKGLELLQIELDKLPPDDPTCRDADCGHWERNNGVYEKHTPGHGGPLMALPEDAYSAVPEGMAGGCKECGVVWFFTEQMRAEHQRNVHAAEYIRLAELAAEAQGKTFLIGVRPMGKGWFAHCDGVEWDGDCPDSAVRSVVQTLAENAKREAISANADAKSLEQRAIDLADTVQLIDGSSEAT